MKCEKYWPEAGERALYGELQVTTVSDIEDPLWTLREFNLKHVRKISSVFDGQLRCN